MAGRGGARPGSGPKPRPPAELRRNRVVLLLTDAELREVQKAAGRQSPSAWIRGVIARAVARRRK
jgi:hypothetical protein